MIDFHKILRLILPLSKRKVKIDSWLYIILQPITYLNNLFYQFKEVTNYKLKFNGQVIYLEHYLNDLYDPSQRRIYIEDTSNTDPNYIFNRVELLPALILYNQSENTPVYFLNNNEYTEQIDFIVKIPSGININSDLLRLEIDYYKQAGKKYKIETF